MLFEQLLTKKKCKFYDELDFLKEELEKPSKRMAFELDEKER